MKHLISFPLAEGGSVQVEVDAFDEGGTAHAGTGVVVEQAKQTFEDALTTILPVTKSVIEKIRGVTQKPNEIEVTFGLNLSVEAGAIIASTSASANFGITMRWSKETQEQHL